MERRQYMINIKHHDTKNTDKIFRAPQVQRSLWSYALEQGMRAALLEGVIIG